MWPLGPQSALQPTNTLNCRASLIPFLFAPHPESITHKHIGGILQWSIPHAHCLWKLKKLIRSQGESQYQGPKSCNAALQVEWLCLPDFCNCILWSYVLASEQLWTASLCELPITVAKCPISPQLWKWCAWKQCGFPDCCVFSSWPLAWNALLSFSTPRFIKKKIPKNCSQRSCLQWSCAFLSHGLPLTWTAKMSPQNPPNALTTIFQPAAGHNHGLCQFSSLTCPPTEFSRQPT